MCNINVEYALKIEYYIIGVLNQNDYLKGGVQKMKSKTFSRLTAMLIVVMLVLSMCVTGISAAAAAVSDGTKVVYLKPNSNWEVDNARFAVYMFEGSNSQWVDMEDDDADGYYAATLPEGNWDKIIFCRMSPSAAENNWNNKWNQTADLDIPDGMNCYTVKDGTWDKGGGEWSYYTPQGATEPTEPTEPTSPATEDEPTTAPLATDYYLFGFINGANYACEEDYENIGEYKFVDGQLTATFETASYVGVKTGDNANWYMTDGWAGIVTEVTLYNTSELGVDANKLMVPAGEVTFTLVDNGDGTLTLSYKAETLPTIPEPETTVEPTEETEPTEEPTEAPVTTEYYLFGYINETNYGCEEDYENIGEYKFVDGQLTATFETASYVGVKTGDNANWYMTDGWAGIVTEVTLYNTSELGVNADKLMVPAGEVTFTLVDNGDGTLTLSYEAETLPTIPEPETTVEPTEETEPTEVTEPTSPATEDEPTTAPSMTEYYLFGFINGANYACEEDYENIGEYKFVDGQLTATFETASYVGVKTGDNANWYMTDGWAGIVTEVTLYNTSELGVNADKLMVPAGEVTFTLVDNGDGTLTLSYEAETLPTIPEPETTVEPTEETDPTEATEPVTDKLIVNAKSNIFPSVTETFDKDEETVTVSYKLSSNMRAVNTQWVLTYDNTKLQYDSADNMSNGEQTICPSAGNDLIFNHEDNCIKGTFSKLNLISFEEGADLVSVTFKVIGTGVADVYLDLEFFTLAYVDGDGIVQDASIVDYGEMQDISGIAGFENAEISTSTVIEGNIMMGDINDDGMISVIDVTMILKYSVGTQSLTASQMKAADVDKDGIVNVKDATMIQKYIAEMIDEL